MPAPRTWTKSELPAPLLLALEAALTLKARVPVVLRVDEVTGYTDWVLLLSGRSDRNVRAIVDAIDEALGKSGVQPIGTDGRTGGQWSLLDYDDFMVHVFFHPVRKHFDLESMWSDAPRVELGLPPELLDESDLLDLEMPSTLPEFRGDLANFGGFADEFKSFDRDEWGDNDEFGDDASADDDLDDAFPGEDEADDDIFDDDEEDGDSGDLDVDDDLSQDSAIDEVDDAESLPADEVEETRDSTSLSADKPATTSATDAAGRKRSAQKKGKEKTPDRTADEDADLFED